MLFMMNNKELIEFDWKTKFYDNRDFGYYTAIKFTERSKRQLFEEEGGKPIKFDWKTKFYDCWDYFGWYRIQFYEHSEVRVFTIEWNKTKEVFI
jgi:hypothetical protein